MPPVLPIVSHNARVRSAQTLARNSLESMSILPKALIAWSSGKDSAWALHEMRGAGGFEIVGALTTVTDPFRRVSMHGVREELLRAQLDAAGLRPVIIQIPFPCSNDIYERKMAEAVAAARSSGVTHIIFGDLFLDDVRAYRERQLSGTGIVPVFPLWGRPTRALAHQMIDLLPIGLDIVD